MDLDAQELKIKKPPKHRGAVCFRRLRFGTFVPHIERLSAQAP